MNISNLSTDVAPFFYFTCSRQTADFWQSVLDTKNALCLVCADMQGLLQYPAQRACQHKSSRKMRIRLHDLELQKMLFSLTSTLISPHNYNMAQFPRCELVWPPVVCFAFKSLGPLGYLIVHSYRYNFRFPATRHIKSTRTHQRICPRAKTHPAHENDAMCRKLCMAYWIFLLSGILRYTDFFSQHRGMGMFQLNEAYSDCALISSTVSSLLKQYTLFDKWASILVYLLPRN